MKIKIIPSGSSTKPLHKSGDFILQNINSLPKCVLVSGKPFRLSKSSERCKLKDNEFIFDKYKNILIFKVPNIYEELNVDIINETNKN